MATIKAIWRGIARLGLFVVAFCVMIVGSSIMLPAALLGLLLFGGRENFLWHIALWPLRAFEYLMERCMGMMEPDPYETQAFKALSNEDLLTVSAYCQHRFSSDITTMRDPTYHHRYLTLCNAECQRRGLTQHSDQQIPVELAEQRIRDQKQLRPFKLIG